jgi:heme/copper-type cytochrome/quinol oxidase subunit 2
MEFVILAVMALAVAGPSLVRRAALEDRLRRHGVRFPILVWGMALGVMVLSMSMNPGAQSRFRGIAFAALLTAPLVAGLLTLTWRDARVEGRTAAPDASPVHPNGTLAAGWVRVCSAILSVLSVVTLAMMAGNQAWREMPMIAVLFAGSTYVAVSGRVPRELARRA